MKKINPNHKCPNCVENEWKESQIKAMSSSRKGRDVSVTCVTTRERDRLYFSTNINGRSACYWIRGKVT